MKQMTDTTPPEWSKWLGGAVAGAVLMYMLDPDRGGARRAQSTDKIRDLTRQTGTALGSAVRGIGDSVSHTVEGISSKLGSTAEQGVVPNGAAMRSAGDQAMQEVGRYADNMTRSAGRTMQDVSRGAGEMMQGARHMVESASQQLKGDWTPGTRGAAVLGGGVLGLMGLMRRSPIGMTLGLAGLALLARGATNQPLRDLMKGQALAQTIDQEKSIYIDAAPEQVYDMWSNYENFPHFMSHVVEVRDKGGRRSHWMVRGPAGARFEWDAVLTEQSRPRRLAWRSEPGAEIPNAGSVEFEPYRGGTRVTVRLSYNPPAGMLGHGLAVLLGSDPKREMDDDLARMKAFIERGVVPRDGARSSGGLLSRFLH